MVAHSLPSRFDCPCTGQIQCKLCQLFSFCKCGLSPSHDARSPHANVGSAFRPMYPRAHGRHADCKLSGVALRSDQSNWLNLFRAKSGDPCDLSLRSACRPTCRSKSRSILAIYRSDQRVDLHVGAKVGRSSIARKVAHVVLCSSFKFVRQLGCQDDLVVDIFF